MATNVIMLQKDELKEVVAEIVENLIGNGVLRMPSAQPDTEYYTRDEACNRLHITFTTLWRLEKRGAIRVHKVGRRSLYAKSDVDALITGGEMKNGSNY